jgi:hypothetical protein
MSESMSRFVLNEIGSIIDTEGRFPPVPLCQCGAHEGNIENHQNNQIDLRRTVLSSQLSRFSGKIESLPEPEAESLVLVIYEIIFVSGLECTIGQNPNKPANIENPDRLTGETADPMSISSFVADVERLLRDLYYDCDQQLMDDLLGSIRGVAHQWDHARTAMSRGFLARLSQQVNQPVRPPGVAIAPNTPTERKA